MKKRVIAIALSGMVCAMLTPILLTEQALTQTTLNLSSLQRDPSFRVQPHHLAFADINGSYGETEIRQLAQLGVFEITSGNFQPSGSITRAEFVTWLVKTYNLLQTHNTRTPTPIRVSDRRTSAFRDVSPSHPAFQYIQAAQDAGFLAGYEDGTFRPNTALTREEMIVLKSPFDSKTSGNSSRSAKSLRAFIQKTKGFRDANQITERYLTHIAFDLGNAASGRNFERVYGMRQRYEPQKAVTRAEAAVVLAQFRKVGTVEQALTRRDRR